MKRFRRTNSVASTAVKYFYIARPRPGPPVTAVMPYAAASRCAGSLLFLTTTASMRGYLLRGGAAEVVTSHHMA